MKKLYIIVFILATILSACSGDDDKNTSPDENYEELPAEANPLVLVKTVTTYTGIPANDYSTEYFYNPEGSLSEIKISPRYNMYNNEKFFYTDGRVTSYEASYNSDVITQASYTYSGDYIVKVFEEHPTGIVDFTNTTLYKQNTNGQTTEYKHYQDDILIAEAGYEYFSNGNIKGLSLTFYDTEDTYRYVSYNYDNKRNPYYNIYNKLRPGMPMIQAGKSNLLKSESDDDQLDATYEYEYNEQLYPVKCTEKSNGLTKITEFYYQ